MTLRTDLVPPGDAPPDRRQIGLHPHARRLWLWQGLLLSAGLVLILLVVGLLMRRPGITGAVPVVAGLMALLVVRHGQAYARSFSCSLLADGLLITRGAWWRREIFVPMQRIQHTDVAQGPLERRWGMATLKVFTAGAHSGQIAIPDLVHKDAIALRDRLLNRHGTDAV
jgi:uncharacterized protein